MIDSLLTVSPLCLPTNSLVYCSLQTQVFHTLYYTNENVLLGAPTGSGKTVAAELAMFRVFREQPKAKCVYIAPLKALVRERISDWFVHAHRCPLKVNQLLFCFLFLAGRCGCSATWASTWWN